MLRQEPEEAWMRKLALLALAIAGGLVIWFSLRHAPSTPSAAVMPSPASLPQPASQPDPTVEGAMPPLDSEIGRQFVNEYYPETVTRYQQAKARYCGGIGRLFVPTPGDGPSEFFFQKSGKIISMCGGMTTCMISGWQTPACKRIKALCPPREWRQCVNQ
jgi:hypothetical protein